MLSHVYIGVGDFDRAFAFYAGIMRELAYPQRFYEPARPWAAWMPRDTQRPLLVIGRPYNGEPATAGNGQMVALLAATRDMVDRCYARAMAAGVVNEGAPGLRPQYHGNYYGAYFRDPDGNKLCVCCHNALT